MSDFPPYNFPQLLLGNARARIGRSDFSFIDEKHFVSKFSRFRQMTLPSPTQ